MNNSSTATAGSGCKSLQCLFSTEERCAIVASLLTIAVVSFIGNVLVCCALSAINPRQKHSALTLSSLHLAIANLMITIFWGPTITIYLYITGEWTLGPVICKLVAFMQNTGVVASLLHLFVVTVEKYLAVCFPFSFRRTNKVAYRCSLAFVWLIALGESAFYIQFKKMKTFNGKDYCIENWPGRKTFRIVTLTKTLFFFLTLFTIMILLGLTIFGLRFEKGNFRPETKRKDERSWRKKRSLQARAIKILVVMLLSVLVCWSPLHVLSLLDLAGTLSDVPARDRLISFTVSLVMFFTVCTIQPIIFLFVKRRGKEFMRQGMNRILFRRNRNVSRRGRSFNSSQFPADAASLRSRAELVLRLNSSF